MGFRIIAPRALCAAGNAGHGKQAHTTAKTWKTGKKPKTEGTSATQRERPQKRTLKRQKARSLTWHVEVQLKLFKKYVGDQRRTSNLITPKPKESTTGGGAILSRHVQEGVDEA